VDGKPRTVSSLLDVEWFSEFFFCSGLKQISRKGYQSLADIIVHRMAQNFSAMHKNTHTHTNLSVSKLNVTM
jgi:hypothetical protein